MQLKKRVFNWLGLGAGALVAASSAAAQISLSSTVDLALRNSTQVRIATADVQRAIANLEETKDVYIPNLVAGASPGPPSIGFPLGQPSLFNITSQSLVYSFSQADYIRASRAAYKSAQLNLSDNKDQVTLDCALAYVQLDTDTRMLAALENEKAHADHLVAIESDRVGAGFDSHMDVTRTRITSAQIDLSRLHTEDDAAEQREKLAHLTGLPPSSFIPDAKSIPPFPDFSDSAEPAEQEAASNSGIQAEYANAKSKLEIAFGDEKQNYRPQFAFGLQYSRFASFENYSQFYQRFSNNNFGAAVQITFPLFDASRRTKARESAADARHAMFEAQQAKNQTSEQVQSLRHSLREVRAQQALAQLQSQYAQEQLAAVQSELQNGTGSPSAAPVTPKEGELAQIEAQQRYEDALKADLSLIRAQLSLMRATGTISDWVRSAGK
ncbi:MAG TPA: TolC family protein [Silvibacterium sp.]|nr:TolC family protein [Silvibacterium sp.]